ncbi:alpha-galactosidase a [Ophiostoma piceae UAMH 11346]|uniref:Alpha-galactosidase a n=1 Tax=Ophiostoma piceae (strain UAMH 11346) TaxID=1262450 RepID=S3CRB0_OPHP1|nr:alpha-galactosidase a [Ophiostoma piceae UAMH 11346]
MANNTKDIQILDQDIDDGAGTFRVRVGKGVRYLNIEKGVFPDNIMSHPAALVSALIREPQCLPDNDWTDVDISRNGRGEISTTTSAYSYDEDDIKLELEHEHAVEVLMLSSKNKIRSGVDEVEWHGPDGNGAAVAAIAKIACFHDQLPRIETETWAYKELEDAYKQGSRPTAVFPRFLAQIVEHGRPMGVLLEKLEGDHAGIDDLAECAAVVRQLHAVGIVHGDLNRYNFVVDRRNGKKVVRVIDFEKAEPFIKEKAEAELQSLAAKLEDESGIGGTFGMPIEQEAAAGQQ